LVKKKSTEIATPVRKMRKTKQNGAFFARMRQFCNSALIA
jgi:hypothetical protein